MKKEIIILLILLVFIPQVNSVIYDSIYEYMHKIDEEIPIIVGLNASSSDSIAATKIVLKILQERNVILEVNTEDKVNLKINKILIGHPCDNHLIKMDCIMWPYDAGQGIIKVIGNDLVISGSTPDDTIRAALAAANYKLFSILKAKKFVLVTGDSLDLGNLQVTQAKEPNEFVCGDQICEVGEKYLCFVDCARKSCDDICRSAGFKSSACRPTTPIVNKSSCYPDETDRGPGYCSTGRSCCCSNKEIKQQETIKQQPPQQEPKIQEPKQESKAYKILKNIILFFTKPKVIAWIIVLVILGALGYLAYYYLKPDLL